MPLCVWLANGIYCSTRYGLVPTLTGMQNDSLAFENPDIGFSSDESLVRWAFLILIKNPCIARDSSFYTRNSKSILLVKQ
ncbi:hypothetical protein BSLA_02f1763 [Burkholderia stabilis]|nr:hypothetical protein BSLA_02f1763 [Burkholderia stabilis]